jgi:hypothetical protein
MESHFKQNFYCCPKNSITGDYIESTYLIDKNNQAWNLQRHPYGMFLIKEQNIVSDWEFEIDDKTLVAINHQVYFLECDGKDFDLYYELKFMIEHSYTNAIEGVIQFNIYKRLLETKYLLKSEKAI